MAIVGFGPPVRCHRNSSDKRLWYKFSVICGMFTHTAEIEGDAVRLEFLLYRSPEGPDIYQIRSDRYIAFMQSDTDSGSWRFLGQVNPALLPLEQVLSAVICEYEQCGQQQDAGSDEYDFLA